MNYDEFQKHASDLQDSITATEAEIQKIDSDISRQRLIQKHCTTYRECKKIVTAGKTASDINKYMEAHQPEYLLFESSKAALKDLGITTLPKSERIQSEIESLEKNATSEKPQCTST